MKNYNKKLLKFISLLLFCPSLTFAQSFPPIPSEIGTTAIQKDSSIIVSWASGIEIQRGFLNISDKSLGLASFGLPENALHQAEGNSFDIVSFGDSGIAVLTFENPIVNGNGFDFAVFENAFSDNYLEFAFVEVSSDGINYLRFPAISEIPINVQMGNYEFSDCRFVNNLAGKYRQGFGTPFDLEELVGLGNQNIDLNNITHVKLIDVIGNINPIFASYDSQNNIINDPWPSEFESGGFDLDGVAVLNQVVGLEENIQVNSSLISIKADLIYSTSDCILKLKIYDLSGQIQIESSEQEINIQQLSSGIYFVKCEFQNKEELFRFYKK